MDYRAAVSRGHAEPRPQNATSAPAPQYRKKEPPKADFTTLVEPAEPPKVERVAPQRTEGHKKQPKSSNLNESWSSGQQHSDSNRRDRSRKDGPRDKPRRPKKEEPPPPQENTFEKIKALHQMRNAQLLAKLQELNGDIDDSDDEDNLWSGGQNLVDPLRQSHGDHNVSTSSSTNGGSQSTASLSNSLHMSQEVTRCSICLDRVKPEQAVWQCSKCFCDLFHLDCITGWIRKERNSNADSEGQGTPSLQEASQQVVVVVQSAAMLKFKATYFQCPNCRGAHELAKAPTESYCMCGKVRDPEPDPWRQPHTCGQICAKKLECGHTCTDVCHIGRCSPCATQNKHNCFCGANSQMLRCGDKLWSCGERCGMRLACGKHRCPLACHPGECPPCAITGLASCQCGAETQEKVCLESIWQCTKVCNKTYDCGKHVCALVCHTAGACGPCPRSLPRTCFCGKQPFVPKSCTQETTSCGRTCGKALACGSHTCERPCHPDDCGACPQLSNRPCECGKTRKQGPCAQPFKCTSPCSLMKSCGLHKCGMRCCKGNGACPPCQRVCEKKLDCGMCICKRPCHDGDCPPCDKTRTNFCRCGFLSETVPCSPKRILPHLVKKSCLGGHATKFVDCSTPPYLLCTRPCGNLLACGNCLCEKPCHEKTRFRTLHTDEQTGEPSVNEICGELAPLRKTKNGTIYIPQRHYGAKSELGEGESHYIPPGSTDDQCALCEKKCLIGYTTCEHVHTGACHIGECPPCNVQLWMDCHCMTKRIQYECYEQLDLVQFDVKKSCQQRCPWKLRCTHQCTKTCHSGECITECVVPIRVVCKCRALKQDLPCHQVARLRNERKVNDIVVLDCGELCATKKSSKDAQKEAQERERQEKLQKIATDQQIRQRKQKEVHTPYVPPPPGPFVVPKRPWQLKLSKQGKIILYSVIGVLVLLFIAVLIFLDRSKKLPSRR